MHVLEYWPKNIESSVFDTFPCLIISLRVFSIQRCPSLCIPKLGMVPDKYRGGRCLTMRASGESGDNLSPIAPVEFESPVGQLLAQILRTHPHLLPAAIDQQLDNLQSDKNDQKEETPQSQDLLYKSASSLSMLVPSIVQLKKSGCMCVHACELE